MKKKINFVRIIAFSLIITMLSSFPVQAVDKKAPKAITIEYDDIEKLVKKENLQIKLNEISLSNMEDALDSADGAQDGIRELQGSIYDVQSGLNEYSNMFPELEPLVQAIKFSLELSSMSFDAQIPSTSGSNSQVKMAELGYKQAELALINSTQNMFILYHQLGDNITQLERSRELLLDQLELTKLSLQYGLVAPSSINDLESAIKELNANYSALLHQRDSLVLQFKGLLGLTYEQEIELGDIPQLNKSYIKKIDLDKDLKEALKNSLSIKSKKTELSDADSKTKKYELQLKENDVTLTFNNQYQLIMEKLDNLSLSENKLNASMNKLEREVIRHSMGLISLMDLKKITNDVETQKSTVRTNSSTLFMEIEKYKAMKSGMI